MQDALLSRILIFFSQIDWTPGSGRLGVAVSAGADSTVLLHALHRLSEPLGLKLLAIHVNHQLRGQESEEDEQWVRTLAGLLGLEIRVFQASVAQVDDNLEQAARQARRSVFRSLIDDCAVTRVALGHTSSDQVETVLFRLLRGTGISGLAAMRPATADGLIRPLLRVSREEVRSWALAQGIAWRDDSSNSDLRFRRNYLRNELLPQIRSRVNPGVDAVLARMAEAAQAEEEYWESFIEEQFQRFAAPFAHGYLCSVSHLNAQPLAVRRRLLRRAFERVKGNLRSLDMAHVEAVLKICGSLEGHNRVMIPGVDALRSFGTLRLSRPGAAGKEKRHYRLAVTPNIDMRLPFGAGTIRISLEHGTPANYSNCVKFVNEKNRIEFVTLDGNALGGDQALNRLSIRNWEPGDSYQPAGRQSEKKIKELFLENRVLLWDRRHWPVLELNGEIVWVREFGAARKFSGEPFSGEQRNGLAVSLTYTPPHESNSLVSTS